MNSTRSRNVTCTQTSPLVDATFDWRRVILKAVKLYCLAGRLVNLSVTYFCNFCTKNRKYCAEISLNVKRKYKQLISFFCCSRKCERSGSRAKLTWTLFGHNLLCTWPTAFTLVWTCCSLKYERNGSFAKLTWTPFGRHLLCTWPIAFIIPWISEKRNLYLNWTSVQTTSFAQESDQRHHSANI